MFSHSLKQMFSLSLVLAASIEVICIILSIIMKKEGKMGVVGTFDTPGGLAVCLCIALPFCFYLYGNKKAKHRSAFFLFLGILIIIMVILTKSRTGWLCLIFYLLSCLKERFYKYLIIRNGMFIFFVICLGVMSFLFKRGSTNGRIFILEQSWELIKEKPIIGHGYGSFNREYMLKQADYFANHKNSNYAWLADDIRHPLNEFVLVWFEFGLLGLLLFITFFLYTIVKTLYYDDTFFYMVYLSLCSIFIFSLFSYPFTYPLTNFFFISCLLYVCIDRLWKYNINKYMYMLGLILSMFVFIYVCVEYKYEYKWSRVMKKSFCGYSREMMPQYDKLYEHFSRNPYFLYNYTAEQFYAERFDNALSTAKECMRYWSSYNLSLLTGDICRMSEDYDEAINFYIQAHCMCPVRFAPLEGLYYSYRNKGDMCKADSIAFIILNKKIKVTSYDVMRIKKEVEIDLNRKR